MSTRPPTSRFHREGLGAGWRQRGAASHGCARAFLLPVGLGAVLGLTGALLGPWGAGLATLALLPSVLRGRLRAGVRSDARGLRECYPLGLGRRLDWDALVGVDLREDGATVHGPGRDIELAPPLADWLLLATQCARAAGVVDGGAAVLELPPGEVATWLHLPADGELVCRSRHHRLHGWRLLAGWTCVSLVGLSLGPVLALPLLLAAVVGWWFGGRLGRRRGQRVDEVRATGTELEVHSDTGWHRYAWGGLRQLTTLYEFRVVSTPDGDLWLPPDLTDRDRLLFAMRQAIDARQQGQALPRLTAGVPETALSLARSGTTEADRGLSR